MKFKHLLRKVCVAALVVAAVVSSAQPASADYDGSWRSTFWRQGPYNPAPDITRPDVIGDCARLNGGARPNCRFVPLSRTTYLSRYERVSPWFDNCNGRGDVVRWYHYSYTSLTTMTVGSSTTLSATVGAQVPFIAAAYSQAWGSSTDYADTRARTAGDLRVQTIRPGTRKAVMYASRMYRVSGYYAANYDSRIFGHYEWYYPGRNSQSVTLTGSILRNDGRVDGRVGEMEQSC